MQGLKDLHHNTTIEPSQVNIEGIGLFSKTILSWCTKDEIEAETALSLSLINQFTAVKASISLGAPLKP